MVDAVGKPNCFIFLLSYWYDIQNERAYTPSQLFHGHPVDPENMYNSDFKLVSFWEIIFETSDESD